MPKIATGGCATSAAMEAKIAHDRWELRRALYYGNYAAAQNERKELRREYRELNRDRRDSYWDRR